MNILEILSRKLKNKHYSELEKVRYIYLRTCELFSYDEKYFINKSLKNEKECLNIMYKKLDITNIEDFKVVCTNYSKYILSILIKELTNVENVAIKTTGHSYVIVKIKNAKYKLDACMIDFTRVKMNLTTNGFYILDKRNDTNFLKEIDNNLQYYYIDEMIMQLHQTNNLPVELLRNINELLINSKCNKYFFDAYHFINILKDENIVGEIYTDKNNLYQMFHLSNEGKDIYYFPNYFNNIYQLKQFNEEESFKLAKTFISTVC